MNLRGRRAPIKSCRGPGGRRICSGCDREVPKGRQNWCSDACVSRWVNRNPGPSLLRAMVFQRDRGVCAVCAQDCKHLQWDADHVIPLHRGGSNCIGNVQTLCVDCHREKSAAEATERARIRRALNQE